jgi:hypothetical protein
MLMIPAREATRLIKKVAFLNQWLGSFGKVEFNLAA